MNNNTLNKKWTIIVCAIIILIGGAIITNNILSKRVTLIKNELTVEAGEELNVTVKDLFKGKTENLDTITLDVSNVDTNKVGDYELTAIYGKKTFNIAVKVVDTTAPIVEITHRVIFINDGTKALKWQDFATIYDVSVGIICKLESFKKVDDVTIIGDAEIIALTNRMESSFTMHEEEMKEYLNLETTAKTVSEEGIYHSIVSFTDAYGNTSYEQVVVVYDTTFANAAFDVSLPICVTVGEEEFKNPTLDLLIYTLIDNVDGTIDCDEYTYKLNPVDSDNGLWELIITYIDRAGNECNHEVLVNLTLDKNMVSGGSSSDNGNNNGNNNGDNTGNNNNGGNSNNGGSTDSGNSGPVSEDYSNLDLWDRNGDGFVDDYERADTNHDGYSSGEELEAYVSPLEQFAMDWAKEQGFYVPFTFVHPYSFEVIYGYVLPSAKYVDQYTIDTRENTTSKVGWDPDYDGTYNEAYHFGEDWEGLMNIEEWEAYTGRTYTGARYRSADSIFDEYLAEIGLRRSNGFTAHDLPNSTDWTKQWKMHYGYVSKGHIVPLQ